MRILTLTGANESENRQLIKRYHSLIEGVEIRLDLLEEGVHPAAAVGALQAEAEHCGLRSILTCRRESDGGRWQGEEESRLKLLERALRPGISYLDLEEEPAAPQEAARRAAARAGECGTRVIGSRHDFGGVPGDWAEWLLHTASRGRIPKLACSPESFSAAAGVYRRLREVRMPEERIVLLMGPFGYFSRILYRRFGSLCTFLSDPARRAVPWHPGPEEFSALYRAEQIGEETPLYGVIGNPVHHSRSPQLHNRWLQRAGLPGTYLPFQVDEAEPFFRFAAEAGVRGFSVTLPLKQAVLPLLDRRSGEVERIGSCNTVLRRNGGWEGWNTDFYGFLAPIEDELGAEKMKSALIVGAGGVACTAAAALSARGLRWTVVNRSPEKARVLAEHFGGQWMEKDEVTESGYWDLVVQTTSAGMEPETEADPLPEYRFGGGELVYELIYAPEETQFLSRARRAGCRTVGGASMLRAQAEEQFRLFTGAEVPPDG